jgi:diguanylate cyclase (GGDEF)-like protein
MSLRKKVVLVFVVALGVISAATYAVSYLLISRNFERLEERIVRANLLRISNAVGHQQQHLDVIANDWGNWSSTYEFMGKKYPEYAEKEIFEATFNRYDINVLLLVDLSGRAVLCRDFGDSDNICGNGNALWFITRAMRRVGGDKGERAVSGLLVIAGRPIQVSATPILRTNHSGPSRGTLLMGRWMDERQVEKIGNMLALSMTAVVGSASGIKRAAAGPDWGEKQWLEPAGKDTIAGFVRIKDIFGGPGMVLSTEFRRDLTHQGRVAQRWLFVEIFGVAMLLQVAGFFLLQRIVLSRIARLGATATAISSTGDLSERVVVSGNDEITALESSFNSMLQDLEESRRELLVAQEALEYHASHDGLTGVLNRAALMVRLRAEMSRAWREEGSVGVMLVDLDHFKHVNDTYGHAAGDDVLRAVMESVKQAVRPYDIVGRYGGEEFLVVVPGAGEHDAMAVAERVRRNVEKLRTTPPVTVSIGVTAANGTEEEKQVLLATDTALYRAKRSGRNRVEFCSGQQHGPSIQEERLSQV